MNSHFRNSYKKIGKLFQFRKCHATKTATTEMKMTASLTPEMEEKFVNGEYLPRNHPGKRKHSVITLPEKLTEACYKVLENYSPNMLAEEVKSLQNVLHSRRLPIEKEELAVRTVKIMNKLEIPLEVLDEEESMENAKMLSKVRKQLSSEVLRWKTINYNEHMSIVYLVSRLAQNYSGIKTVFSEIMTSAPSFKPTTFFDYGSGVGTALWAAHELWSDSIKEYFCIDTSNHMNMLCQLLLQGGDPDAPVMVKNLFFRQFLPVSSERKYDLVVSAFSLMDLTSSESRLRVIDTLWNKTKDILVIIDNGSQAGFTAVLEARDYILKLEEEFAQPDSVGVHIVGPCPHAMPCPKMASRIPCTFSARFHKFYPSNMTGTVRTELFSYVVLRKGKQKENVNEDWPRVIETVITRSRLAMCRLCCSNGKAHEIIFTKGKNSKFTYQCAKSSKHGDILPMKLQEIPKKQNRNDYIENEDVSDEQDSDINKQDRKGNTN